MTLMFSIGRYGGFYVHGHRLCLGWFAITWFPWDCDDVMTAGLDALKFPK